MSCGVFDASLFVVIGLPFCWSCSLICFFFFFSSRRRHTRYWRDWSSDVCSSDLAARATPSGVCSDEERVHRPARETVGEEPAAGRAYPPAVVPEADLAQTDAGLVPASSGWFVMNTRDARWFHRPGRGGSLPDSSALRPEFTSDGITYQIGRAHV